MNIRMIVVVALSMLIGGCAVGNRYEYSQIVAEPEVSGSSSVSVGTHDQRDYVLSGNKDPQFVGLQRGGFGNPFDVRTEGDRPLADDMSASIVNSLKRKGFRAQAVTVTHSDTPVAVRNLLRDGNADRSLLLTIREWKSDAVMRLGLSFDLSMTVLDKSGVVLAEKRIQARDEVLGAAGMPSSMGPVVANAFKAKLEELLNDKGIAKALSDE